MTSLATAHFELQPGLYQLGRSTPHDPDDKLAIPFDPKLSRRTARLEVKQSHIVVWRDGSRSPIFTEQEERDRFELLPGGRFCVAETVFELLSELAQTVTDDDLHQARQRPAEQVMALMLEVQPILDENTPVPELVARLNQVLPKARVGLFDETLKTTGPLTPSRSLVSQALQQQAPVFYEWIGPAHDQPTANQNESWALAVPIGSGQTRLVLYAVGHFAADPLERGGYCLLAQMVSDHLAARQLKTGKAPGEGLRIKSLGEFEAHMGGVRLDEGWGGKQLSWLLSYLASAQQTVTEDRLMEAFWPGKGNRARRSLMVALSKLRNSLRQDGLESNPIPRNHTGYRLDEGLDFWHDYCEVESLLATIAAADPDQALSAGQRLLELYVGPYLEGCYLDWAAHTRTKLEGEMQLAYQRVAQAALQSERLELALKFGELSLELEPCCQASRLVCMSALMGLGRPEQAVRHFEECRKQLAADLQMEPSLALEEAYQRALISLS